MDYRNLASYAVETCLLEQEGFSDSAEDFVRNRELLYAALSAHLCARNINLFPVKLRENISKVANGTMAVSDQETLHKMLIDMVKSAIDKKYFASPSEAGAAAEVVHSGFAFQLYALLMQNLNTLPHANTTYVLMPDRKGIEKLNDSLEVTGSTFSAREPDDAHLQVRGTLLYHRTKYMSYCKFVNPEPGVLKAEYNTLYPVDELMDALESARREFADQYVWAPIMFPEFMVNATALRGKVDDVDELIDVCHDQPLARLTELLKYLDIGLGDREFTEDDVKQAQGNFQHYLQLCGEAFDHLVSFYNTSTSVDRMFTARTPQPPVTPQSEASE